MAVSIVNLTNAPLEIKVAGETIETVQPDGRQAYSVVQNTIADPLLVGAEDTEIPFRGQIIDQVIVTDDLAGGELSVFPAPVANTIYVTTLDIVRIMRRSDVVWMSADDDTIFYAGKNP